MTEQEKITRELERWCRDIIRGTANIKEHSPLHTDEDGMKITCLEFTLTDGLYVEVMRTKCDGRTDVMVSGELFDSFHIDPETNKSIYRALSFVETRNQ